jgi:hypothetical protein
LLHLGGHSVTFLDEKHAAWAQRRHDPSQRVSRARQVHQRSSTMGEIEIRLEFQLSDVQFMHSQVSASPVRKRVLMSAATT